MNKLLVSLTMWTALGAAGAWHLRPAFAEAPTGLPAAAPAPAPDKDDGPGTWTLVLAGTAALALVAYRQRH